MRFLRSESQSLRQTAWSLILPVGTLDSWNRGFDAQMKPDRVIDRRGKSGEVTVEVVRQIVDKAAELKVRGSRLRIGSFTSKLKEHLGLELSQKTVTDILIANDLYKPEIRRRRPRFYRNLCQRIPNGLLSLDGSEIVVGIGDIAEKFILELGVDVGSFCHTGYGLHRSETAEAVIGALESHRRRWGVPLGVVFDHGSANMSDQVLQYLRDHKIEVVPAGPGNPKGNGTGEGAFSQLKATLGKIRIDTSSTEALARSVVEKLLSVYITMRNQMALHRCGKSPSSQMKTPVTNAQRQNERQRLADHKQAKNAPDANQPKYDRLDWLIAQHGLCPEPPELDRARRSIRGYDEQAIAQAEEAFLKAVNRNGSRKNLSYFFGILRNVQKDLDTQRYQHYCRKRYNYELMLEEQRRQRLTEQHNALPTVDEIVKMAVQAVTQKVKKIKAVAERKTQQWVGELLEAAGYVASVRKKLQDAIGALSHLGARQKEQVWKLLERFLDQKPATESVTLFS